MRKLSLIAGTLITGAELVDPGAVHDMHAPSLAEERTHHAAREKAVRLYWIRADKRSPRSPARGVLGNLPGVRQACDRQKPAALGQCGSGFEPAIANPFDAQIAGPQPHIPAGKCKAILAHGMGVYQYGNFVE
jgi:hypothetical protein